MSNRTLYLIRHPETFANKEKRMLGWSDSPLSTVGEQQKEDLIAAFEGVPLDRVITSPLERCLTVARTLAHTASAPLDRDERLKEMGLGTAEGSTFEELQSLTGQMYWYKEDMERLVPNAERLESFKTRVESFRESLYGATGDTIAIVSHGGVIRQMIATYLSMAEDALFALYLDNASTSILELSDRTPLLKRLGLSPQEFASYRSL